MRVARHAQQHTKAKTAQLTPTTRQRVFSYAVRLSRFVSGGRTNDLNLGIHPCLTGNSRAERLPVPGPEE